MARTMAVFVTARPQPDLVPSTQMRLPTSNEADQQTNLDGMSANLVCEVTWCFAGADPCRSPLVTLLGTNW